MLERNTENLQLDQMPYDILGIIVQLLIDSKQLELMAISSGAVKNFKKLFKDLRNLLLVNKVLNRRIEMHLSTNMLFRPVLMARIQAVRNFRLQQIQLLEEMNESRQDSYRCWPKKMIYTAVGSCALCLAVAYLIRDDIKVAASFVVFSALIILALVTNAVTVCIAAEYQRVNYDKINHMRDQQIEEGRYQTRYVGI